MDKLSVLAEFENIAVRENLEDDAFKLFLLLLVNYDSEKQYGEISRSVIMTSLGKFFPLALLSRAFRRLAALGLIEIVLPPHGKVAKKDSIMIYRIPLATTGRG
jgi:hypothetical protein